MIWRASFSGTGWASLCRCLRSLALLVPGWALKVAQDCLKVMWNYLSKQLGPCWRNFLDTAKPANIVPPWSSGYSMECRGRIECLSARELRKDRLTQSFACDLGRKHSEKAWSRHRHWDDGGDARLVAPLSSLVLGLCDWKPAALQPRDDSSDANGA